MDAQEFPFLSFPRLLQLSVGMLLYRAVQQLKGFSADNNFDQSVFFAQSSEEMCKNRLQRYDFDLSVASQLNTIIIIIWLVWVELSKTALYFGDELYSAAYGL